MAYSGGLDTSVCIRWIQEKYAITLRGRLGPAKNDNNEGTLPNRVVRWVDGYGLELEVDPRQGEI